MTDLEQIELEEFDGSEFPARRGFVIVLLVVVLLVAAVVDRSNRAGPASTAETADMPTAPEPGSLTSTWYCAAGTADSGGAADVSLVVVNPGGRSIRAAVTVVPSEGQRATRRLTVPSRSRQVLRLQDVVTAKYAAALVDVDGGAAVVEHVVTGALGDSAAPCASAASDHWYFADGATTREATFLLALFNPFPENAIADLSFATDQGRAVPRALQGLVIPAQSLVVRDIGEFVRRRETLATSINVRSGRLVAEKLQLHNGGGRKGMALVLGAPSTGGRWMFADGFIVDGVTEDIAVYNPGEREARVDVELALEKGAVEPFELTVPARERVTLAANKESRIPKADPHAITVIRRSGPGVVAERILGATVPSPRTGFADTLGARRAARRWYFPAGAATATLDEWIIVHNPGPRPARVSFSLVAAGQALALDGLQDVTIPAGRRQSFRIGDHVERADTSLIVDATGPVVAERGLYRVNALGFSNTIGIPAP
jgi:hypothetical protein